MITIFSPFLTQLFFQPSSAEPPAQILLRTPSHSSQPQISKFKPRIPREIYENVCCSK